MRERGVYSVSYGWADVTERAGAKMGTKNKCFLCVRCSGATLSHSQRLSANTSWILIAEVMVLDNYPMRF
jgi:hypothetical protein